jgi:DNA-binding LytR/AlgR family response regulator
MTHQFYLHKQGQNAAFPELPQPDDMLKMHIQNRGKTSLPMADLMFLQGEGNYCWLYWKGGQRMLSSRTLKHYAAQLPAAWFVRSHRNCIVNLHYIEYMKYITTTKCGLLHLRTGVELPISRRRWLAMKKIYQSLQS